MLRVHVAVTRVFWEVVEVDAVTREEAEERAAELFQCDWSNSDRVELRTVLLTEDGQEIRKEVQQ
jgi:hypothetical protein